MRYVLAVLMLLPQVALADRPPMCLRGGHPVPIGEILEKASTDWKEELLFRAITVDGKLKLVLFEPETGDYTEVVVDPDTGLACVVDFGTGLQLIYQPGTSL